jgi:3-oxoacyl-[acyl-carrier-protein] synthase II
MADPEPAQVVITGVSATSAFGRGAGPLLAGALDGRPAFGPVGRFSAERRRAKAAAELPGRPALADELVAVIGEACGMAGLSPGERGSATFLLALHTDAAAARSTGNTVTGSTGAVVAARTGLPEPPRVYVTACVAASTAIADAAAMIVSGRAGRVVVAAGYLVDEDSFALFDGGRVLARDGQVRPFSLGRQGLLLGDGVAAVVLEPAAAARRRGASPLARLAGWGRAGDAYHVCQPDPDGGGLARAIDAALRRALGPHAGEVPVSSTKSVHGHALEASALLELVLTVLALRARRLPVNAGFLAPDEECRLNLVLGSAREAGCRYALSLNAAFGGASTALLVAAA